MKNSFYLPILLTALVFTSCDPDDADNLCCEPVTVIAPDTYTFEREEESSVSHTGQTCRVQMSEDIYNALKSPEYSADDIVLMFDNGVGFPVEYTCGKNVGSKTSASSIASSTVKLQFDDMINHVATNVFPVWNNSASAGLAGMVTESDGDKRYVDASGLEVNQAFTKGLIGALCLDQITNNYLTPSKLDGGSNDATSLLAGEYTDMEHYWDEGYGYLYGYNNEHTGGNEDGSINDNSVGIAEGKGVLLNKYLKKINDDNQPGIADIVYNAFKLGRAAIVAGDYMLRDEQAVIIKTELDKVIAYKAVDYLREGAVTITSGASRADAFHGLSEGYGFVLSLQFTNYFSNAEVNSMLDELMAGNGFWDVTADQLNAMANNISAVAGL